MSVEDVLCSLGLPGDELQRLWAQDHLGITTIDELMEVLAVAMRRATKVNLALIDSHTPSNRQINPDDNMLRNELGVKSLLGRSRLLRFISEYTADAQPRSVAPQPPAAAALPHPPGSASYEPRRREVWTFSQPFSTA